MATKIFLWGSVRSTANSVSLRLGRSLQFVVVEASQAYDIADWIDNPVTYGCAFGHGSVPGSICFHWDPPVVPPTAKSVLKVWRGQGGWTFNPSGNTIVLLSRAESKELAEALRDVANTIPQVANSIP